MEMTSLKLDIYSLGKRLSSYSESRTLNCSKNTSNDRSRLANEISEISINEFDNLCCKTAVMTEKERERYRRNLEARVQLTDSQASSSNQAVQDSPADCSIGKACGSSHKGKNVLQVSEVEQLSERLKILEEETETMKQAFFEIREERRKLVSQIYQKLWEIHHFVHLGNQFTDEITSDGSLIANPCKDKRYETGLSQVLCQDSSPCIVTRDHRANMLALQEAGDRSNGLCMYPQIDDSL